jgi:hypothetical protein
VHELRLRRYLSSCEEYLLQAKLDHLAAPSASSRPRLGVAVAPARGVPKDAERIAAMPKTGAAAPPPPNGDAAGRWSAPWPAAAAGAAPAAGCAEPEPFVAGVLPSAQGSEPPAAPKGWGCCGCCCCCCWVAAAPAGASAVLPAVESGERTPPAMVATGAGAAAEGCRGVRAAKAGVPNTGAAAEHQESLAAIAATNRTCQMHAVPCAAVVARLRQQVSCTFAAGPKGCWSLGVVCSATGGCAATAKGAAFCAEGTALCASTRRQATQPPASDGRPEELLGLCAAAAATRGGRLLRAAKAAPRNGGGPAAAVRLHRRWRRGRRGRAALAAPQAQPGTTAWRTCTVDRLSELIAQSTMVRRGMLAHTFPLLPLATQYDPWGSTSIHS